MTESRVPDPIVGQVLALVPAMRRNAAERDDTATFPAEDIAALRSVGALAVRLPVEGAEWAVAADQLAAVLTAIGSANLSVGRLFEAHVNARHLIGRYGTAEQHGAVRRSTGDGDLFALWVTDPPTGALRMELTATGCRLTGGKMFCSGAGHVEQAVITAMTAAGTHQMLVVRLTGEERVETLPGPLQGMRSAVTGMVDFTGVTLGPEAILGQPGDYLREPDFSAGAWRGSAVALGGLNALVEAAIDDLGSRDRIRLPHHLARMGQAMIARETGRLWVRDAARTGEDPHADPRDAVAYVGLARIAVETACLDAMRLVQRSLGLSAFRRGHAVERICRDLATYLRQPAPDEVLCEAASWMACRTVWDPP